MNQICTIYGTEPLISVCCCDYFTWLCCSCSWNVLLPPRNLPNSYHSSKLRLTLTSLERSFLSAPPSPLSPSGPRAHCSLWSLCWTMDLRVWSSLKGDWHRASSPSIKAWKSKYGGRSQSVLFSWFHQMAGNGLKLRNGQFLQLTVEEFKKLARKRHLIFYVHIPLRELAS